MATRFERNRTGKKRVSMREISRIAGVNQSTVSRILNGTSGKYKYAEETVRRVKEIAKSLGYRPNRLVHGVFTGKTFAIGVIVPPTDFYRRILQGIHDKLLEKHYACILGWNRQNIEEKGNSNQEELIQQMLEHRVEGIILRPTIDDASDQEFLSVHNAGVPIVAVDREIPYVKADFVGSDDLEGGKQALQYLVEKGHTRIIHVATPMSISSISHRRQGFLDAAVNYECSIQTVPCNHRKVEERLTPILARIEPPVAVFCEMDTYLPDVYRAARATGLKIPEDVSVIGYGNLPLRNYLEPKPASIDQNPYQVGIRAAEMMFDRIDGEKELPETVKSYIPTRLVPGESVAEVRH